MRINETKILEVGLIRNYITEYKDNILNLMHIRYTKKGKNYFNIYFYFNMFKVNHIYMYKVNKLLS